MVSSSLTFLHILWTGSTQSFPKLVSSQSIWSIFWPKTVEKVLEMFKRKITLSVITGLLGALAISGTVFAQEKQSDSTPDNSVNERIAEILGIERETLDSAIKTARKEYLKAKHYKSLAAMVEAGTITQEQANEIDTWKDNKPEVIDRLKELVRENGGVKRHPEANLVEKGVITQAEADEILAWKDAKPSYLNKLRESLKYRRDMKSPKSRHDRARNQHPDYERPGLSN